MTVALLAAAAIGAWSTRDVERSEGRARARPRSQSPQRPTTRGSDVATHESRAADAGRAPPAERDAVVRDALIATLARTASR